MTTTSSLRSLNIHNINPHVVEAKYAVRGELAVRSEDYRAKLARGGSDLPFDKVVSANIGNPQQLDQKPITFFRQVLSLLEYPPLLEHENVLLEQLGYKTDVIERARWLLKQVGSVGAYSASAGAVGIKESIAKFIESMCRLSLALVTLLILVQDEMDSQPIQKTYIFLQAHPLELTPFCISSVPAPKPVSLSLSLNIHSILHLSQFSTQNACHTISTNRSTGEPTSKL
jgi:hypothetical protein